MNKSRYITTLLVAASSMGLLETQAFAENQDADMKPIVFMVLDTSGTMNNLIDADKNETRLTAALGEIIGSSKNVNSAGKLVRLEEPSDYIYMPFPIWSCESGTCKFEYRTKKIAAKEAENPDNKVAVKIAKPKVFKNATSSDLVSLTNENDVKNYATRFNDAYYDNGIIQAYQSLVKFGFAGMAVGDAGSSGGKDSAVKAAAKAAGGVVDKNADGTPIALGFSIVWDNGSYNSNSDLDIHAWEFENASKHTYGTSCSGLSNCSAKDHLYFSNHNFQYGHSISSYGGYVDVDVQCPAESGSWGGKIIPGYYDNKRIGVENVYYGYANKMKPGNVFDFSVHAWDSRNRGTDGFSAQISFQNSNLCPVTYEFKYSTKIPSNADSPGSSYYAATKGIFQVARVQYNGTKNGVPSFELLNTAITPTLIDSSGEPTHIYGYDSYQGKTLTKNTDYYGRKLSHLPYKTPSDCGLDSGMWDSSIDSDAPLIYPTIQNEDDDVQRSNQALIEKVRTYMPTASTPIGEVLADLYYMFGLDDPDNFKTVADKNLISQELSAGVTTYDDYYPCRKKAIVFISDGTPNGSGLLDNNESNIGHSQNVWIDSYHLYKKGIPVYVVGYAEFVKETKDAYGHITKEYMRPDIPDTETDEDKKAATILNKMAWKGGTCYNEKGKFVEPDSDSQYSEFVKGFDTHHRYCFINAGDGAALRTALNGFMSNITKSIVSKTRVVNTSAISYRPVKPYTSYDKNFTNGYYNIYSGYNSTLGNITKAILYRKATLCQNGAGASGKFEIDSNQEIDLAARLKNDVNTCAKTSKKEDICLQSRYIFTGDYATDRYKIAPDIVPLITENDDGKTAGLIANANMGKDFNFLIHDVEKSTNCDAEYNLPLSSYEVSANYILSPYECVNDFDCNVNESEGSNRMCELGRCTDTKLLSCNNKKPGQLCIAGMAIDKTGPCERHSDCKGPGFVCHAGECLQGTVTSCDVRSFVASQPLGRIEYATPVVVEPPTRAYRGHNYATMSQKYWDRDTMLLAGANDGMLHAFVLGSNNTVQFDSKGTGKYSPTTLSKGLKNAPNNITEGQELWGFIPKSVLPTIQRVTTFEPNKYVNATPVVEDVLLPKSATSTLYPEDKEGTVVNPWRTVVVGGFHDGARGYYALDITDPAKPRILWEIGPTWQPTKNPTTHKDLGDNATVSKTEVIAQSQMDSDEGFPFLQMGYTYAEPIITYATTSLVDGKATIEPVAILPGGVPKNNDTTTTNDETGKVLYVVRLFPNSKEDLIVKTFHFDHAISGSPQVYPSTFKSTAQLLYVGDDDGNLYRINLKGTPDKWRSNDIKTKDTLTIEEPIFYASSLENSSTTDSGYEQIVARPAVARFNKSYDPFDTVQIAFGTGSSENFIINSNQKNYVAVFYDVPDNLGNYTLNPISVYASYTPKALVFSKSMTGNKPIEKTVTLHTSSGDSEVTTKFDAWITDPADPKQSKLHSRQKMTGSPIIYNFDAYFPTYVADEKSVEQCGLGAARIYKLTSTGTTPYAINRSDEVQNIGNTLSNASDGDGNPFKDKSYLEIQNTRIYGIEITKQQTCLSEKGKHIAAPQLVAMTGQTTDPGVKANEQDKLLGQTGAGQITTVALNLEAIQPVTREAKWATVYE